MSPPTFVSVEYITDLGPEDVLSGRGGATNSYKGNRAFRALVKEYQEKYLQAKKRDKPAVASIIVELIRKKGGRFLSRSNDKGNHHGQDLWVDIGDDRAREKTCQALREGAPEIRRKRRGSSKNKSIGSHASSFDDDEEATRGGEAKDTDANFSSPSTIERTNSRGGGVTSSQGVNRSNEDDSDSDDHTPEVRNGTGNHQDEGPISIRPWARLIPDRPPVGPIPLDQLSEQDRDLYLRDFLPPCPTVRSESSQYAQHPGRDNLSSMPYGDYDHHSEQDRKLPASKGATWPLLMA
jgi:hypothetical protein